MGWVVAAMLLQGAVGARPVVGDFRYRREIKVAAGAEAMACAVLDGNVYAHAGVGLEDVRLFGGDGGEVPYVMTSSGTEALGDEAATVLNAGVRGGHVVFDLKMPERAYSQVKLGLAGVDYVATAMVTGLDDVDEKGGTGLGTFTLFDLSGQRLGSNTTVALGEASFPYLHVDLAVSGVAGKAAPVVTVQSAEVPPSREAQTLYTTVAATSAIEQRARESVATFELPARVPVERVSFVVGSAGNFSRTVEVRVPGAGEVVRGEISRVRLKEGGKEVKQEQLEVGAVLGANGQVGVKVEVAVENGDDKPLGIAGVRLEMRERKVCFDVPAGGVQMAYGDAGLGGPVYDYGRLFVAGEAARVGVLEGETVSAGKVVVRPFAERHPGLLWVALVGMVGVLGGVAWKSGRKV